ncbi:hypothetical protein [Serratia fonticola]|uniref:Uncharacterized protein n=1 Tax=Serratia fonticola TaxID=47917 RepID=A0AAW3WN46_SERFO|nr:hypothetical protein [Serratia fonticola]MBC3212450.1 hypothetical protein [Serratia fonticola]NYA12988.1 hypothetical protein [Serratia fonticola]NYA32566.1 hypothetical protein [Serratia fonticola]
MKTPTKVAKKTTPLRTERSRSGPTLTGAQCLEGVQAVLQVAGQAMNLASEKERTEQVKAQSLRDMHLSNNEVEIAHLKVTERRDELMTERMALDNSRQDADIKHEEWMQDYEMREKTIELLREKIRQGDVSVQELELLDRLHIPSSNQ